MVGPSKTGETGVPLKKDDGLELGRMLFVLGKREQVRSRPVDPSKFVERGTGHQEGSYLLIFI